MKKIRLGKSPITNTVYAGKLNKAGDMWIGEKHDVTEDFLQVMSEMIPNNGGIKIDDSKEGQSLFTNFPVTKQGMEKAVEFFTKRLSEISTPFS